MRSFEFVDTVTASLAFALASVDHVGLPADWDGIARSPPLARALCRRLAIQLYADLDGTMLLDLALDKIEFERVTRSTTARL